MADSNKPILVLHYVGKLGSGGVEKLLVSLMENIDKEVVSFDFLLWNRDDVGFYDEYVQSLGAKLVYLDIPKCKNGIMRMIAKSIKLFAFLHKSNYRILHTHGTQPIQYVYAFLAKLAGIKTVIIHAHNTQSLTRLRTLQLPVFKTLFRSYPSYYLACSKEAADYMWPKGVGKKSSILINGICFSKYAFNEDTREKFRTKNGIDKEFVIGHIGRFVSQKNHEFLIQVFDEVQKVIPDSVLLLIGEGELKEQISNKLKVLNIKDKVIFLGTTNDIPAVLMAMDVMCFPSLYEGLGIVAIEAQATSLNIVVSEGVPDSANISRYYHKLSLSDSPKKWAEKICSLRNKSHNDGLENMQNSIYDIKETANKLVQIYKRLEEKHD